MSNSSSALVRNGTRNNGAVSALNTLAPRVVAALARQVIQYAASQNSRGGGQSQIGTTTGRGGTKRRGKKRGGNRRPGVNVNTGPTSSLNMPSFRRSITVLLDVVVNTASAPNSMIHSISRGIINASTDTPLLAPGNVGTSNDAIITAYRTMTVKSVAVQFIPSFASTTKAYCAIGYSNKFQYNPGNLAFFPNVCNQWGISGNGERVAFTVVPSGMHGDQIPTSTGDSDDPTELRLGCFGLYVYGSVAGSIGYVQYTFDVLLHDA